MDCSCSRRFCSTSAWSVRKIPFGGWQKPPSRVCARFVWSLKFLFFFCCSSKLKKMIFLFSFCFVLQREKDCVLRLVPSNFSSSFIASRKNNKNFLLIVPFCSLSSLLSRKRKMIDFRVCTVSSRVLRWRDENPIFCARLLLEMMGFFPSAYCGTSGLRSLMRL